MAFTQELLHTHINDTCMSNFAQQVLASTAAIDNPPIDKYTKDLLHHLKSRTPSTESPKHPQIQTLARTNNPGRHLGIYKSLAKHFLPPKGKDAPTPPELPNPIQCGNDILELPISMSCQTHPHLQMMENNMDTIVRKRPWKPTARSTMYHLYKVDYNLLMKWFWSKGFILHSEKHTKLWTTKTGEDPDDAK